MQITMVTWRDLSICHLELEIHHDPWNGWILTISFVAEMATLQVLAGANLPSHTTPLPGLLKSSKLGRLGKPMWQKILNGYPTTHWWIPRTLLVIHNSLEIRLFHHPFFQGFHCFRGDCPLGTSLLKGLHVCGDSTYPGIGVPSAAMSGHICAVGIHRWGWGLDGVKFSHGSSFPQLHGFQWIMTRDDLRGTCDWREVGHVFFCLFPDFLVDGVRFFWIELRVLCISLLGSFLKVFFSLGQISSTDIYQIRNETMMET